MVIDRSIAVESSKKLFTIQQYLSHDECDIVQEYVNNNMHRSFDRSEYQVNTGVKGDSGKYRSFLICPEIEPKLWSDVFAGRTINEIPLDSVMVNIYTNGDFIPPHRDKQGSIYTVTAPLQTSTDRLIFGDDPESFYDDDETDVTVCEDVRGVGYGFYGNSPLHWVPTVKQDLRVSLICLYGAMTY